MEDTKLTDQNTSKIDAALAAAKARKAAKGEGNTTNLLGTGTTSKAPNEPKKKATDEEKAAKLQQQADERAARKAKRDEERSQRAALREANKQPAHMKKVQKAAEKLGTLGQSAQLLYNEATTNLTAAELATLALHIQHFNRSKATERSIASEIKPGQLVRIVDGEPRYIGQTGTVVKTQRIRCYVNIPGVNNRPVPGTDGTGVYFFTSDVVGTTAESEETTDDDQAESTVDTTDEVTEEPIAAAG